MLVFDRMDVFTCFEQEDNLLHRLPGDGLDQSHPNDQNYQTDDCHSDEKNVACPRDQVVLRLLKLA